MKNLTQDPPRRRAPVTRRAIDLRRQPLVATRFFSPDRTLPLVCEPLIEGVELPRWLSDNLDFVEESLLRHGAVLFRGFGLRTQSDFEAAVAAARIPLMEYVESATPRLRLGDRIYTSTEFPPECPIALHNELSYVNAWPLRICFFCEAAPREGGETPLADVRRVLRRIDPAVRAEFERAGWRLVRNYGTGFGLTWQESFHTNDRERVEEYCGRGGVEFEWRGDGLRTCHTRPAVARHPRCGEPVWFNHVAFWHVSSLACEVRERFLAEFAEGEYPFNTYYGDGRVIADPVVEHLRRAYELETTAFAWREGDLLIADNMLVAHGRAPFKGPRRILAAMGEAVARAEVD